MADAYTSYHSTMHAPKHQSLFIVADDVTGAADSAARCHRAGLTATIQVLAQPALPATAAVALSTDSRFLSPAAAADQVRRVVRPLLAAGQARDITWYKKIDSTLRGNLGTELAALLALVTPAGVSPCALICPAFPAQGRGLVDGTLVYADAPAQPPHLPTLLAAQCDLPIATVRLAQVRAGAAALQQILRQFQQQGAQLLVVDGVTEEDLATICAAAVQLPHALLCGSAGLVGHLAITLAAALPPTPPPLPFPLHRPLLTVVGSGSRMAHRQVAALRQAMGLPIIEVTQSLAPAQALAQLMSTTGSPRGDCLLHLPVPPPAVTLEGEQARTYVEALTRLALVIMEAVPPATLLIVGGDTAIHLLTTLGIAQLQVQEELLPGMPLCTGVNLAGQRFTVILKAGNHGDAETLVALYRRME